MADLRPADGIVATYRYRDEHGTLLYENVRLTPKSFRLRRRNAKGEWVWKMDGVRRADVENPDCTSPFTVEVPTIGLLLGAHEVVAVTLRHLDLASPANRYQATPLHHERAVVDRFAAIADDGLRAALERMQAGLANRGHR